MTDSAPANVPSGRISGTAATKRTWGACATSGCDAKRGSSDASGATTTSRASVMRAANDACNGKSRTSHPVAATIDSALLDKKPRSATGASVAREASTTTRSKDESRCRRLLDAVVIIFLPERDLGRDHYTACRNCPHGPFRAAQRPGPETLRVTKGASIHEKP